MSYLPKGKNKFYKGVNFGEKSACNISFIHLKTMLHL